MHGNITSRKLSIYLSVSFILIYLAFLHIFRENEWMLTVGGNIFQVLSPLLPFIWLMRKYRECRDNERNFWLFLSLGTLFFQVAMIAWMYYELYLKVVTPFPSIADLFWNLMVLFNFLAFLYLIYLNRKAIRLIQNIYDALIVIIVAASANWEFILKPMLQNSVDQGLLFKIAGASYPIGDLLILFIMLCFIHSASIKLPSKISLLLFLGMLSFLIADTCYLYLLTTDQYSVGHPVDLLWTVGMFLIGISTFYSTDSLVMRSAPHKMASHSILSSRRYLLSIRLWAPYLSVILLFTILVIQDNGFNTIAIGCMVSILLIIFRQIFTLLENRKLLEESARLNLELEQQVQQRTLQLTEKNQQLEILIKEADYLAYHDPLTGLPNRRLFENSLSSALHAAKENNGFVAVLFLDLDRFKLINDTLGHSTGDLLLLQVAKRLHSCIGEAGMVFRQGGDEFLILVPHADRKAIECLANHILDTLSKVYLIDNHELFISSSIGISMFPDDGGELEALTKRADMAMYSAKRVYCNQFMFYESSMDMRNHLVFDLEKDLRFALERKEFMLVYQPLVDIHTREIKGVEALIRWQHPSRGWVSPQQFIPVAEETRIIIPLGLWVLEAACMQWRAWIEKGYTPISIAVNISINQFLHPNFFDDVCQVIQKTGMNPEFLEFELTENIPFISCRSSELLFAFNNMGIRISIDDFGTGYSSLQYLKKLPIHTLKIDQSFIKELPHNQSDMAIVQTVIALSQKLNLKVVAEGVELTEQLSFLQKHHCHYAQGYLFSKPLSPEELEFQFLEGRPLGDSYSAI